MRKLFSLVLGVGIGGAIGAGIMVLLGSQSREKIVANLRQGWDETMVEARHASQEKRLELQAQLAAKRLQKP